MIRTKNLTASMALMVILLGGGLASATTPVNDITLFSPTGETGPIYTQPATITEIASGGRLYSGFDAPSQFGSENAVAHDFFWGTGGAEPTTLSDVFSTPDVTNGVLNPGDTGTGYLDFLFPSTISDLIGDDVFIFNPDTLTSTEDWQIEAITGGTLASPVISGSSVVFDGAAFGATSSDAAHQRNSGGNFTQPVHGIGIDLGEFGVGSLIGVRITTPDGDPSAVVAGGASVPFNGVSNIQTTLNGDSQDIVSVTYFSEGVQKTVNVGDMTNVNVVHFVGESATNIAAAGESGPAPAVGARSALMEDNAVNSGVFNFGAGSGLTAPFDATTPGMGLEFTTPVLNGPGPDVLILEADDGDADPIVVSPLLFEAGLNSTTIDASDATYIDPLSPTFNLFEFTGGTPQSLAELDTAAIADSGGSFGAFNLNATLLDLSDLGYAEGELVSGLFLQAGDTSDIADTLLVVGIQTSPIPEPGALALAALGVVGSILAWRIRGRRKTV